MPNMASFTIISALLLLGVAGWCQAGDDFKYEHGFYISHKGESFGDGHKDGYKKEHGFGYAKVSGQKHGHHEYSFGHEVKQESYEAPEPKKKIHHVVVKVPEVHKIPYVVKVPEVKHVPVVHKIPEYHKVPVVHKIPVVHKVPYTVYQKVPVFIKEEHHSGGGDDGGHHIGGFSSSGGGDDHSSFGGSH